VEVRYLPHYLRLASMLHWMGKLPMVGRWFRARLLLTCVKAGLASDATRNSALL
jgi:hypothetical protein